MKTLQEFVKESAKVKIHHGRVPSSWKLDKPVQHLILHNPAFIEEEYNFENSDLFGFGLSIHGDGNIRLSDKFLSFVKQLQTSVQITTLTLKNLEIEKQTFETMLNELKPSLKTLKIASVPLDSDKIKVLNETRLELEALSLEYIEPDQNDAFNPKKKSEPNQLEAENIDLTFANFKPTLRLLEIRGIAFPEILLDSIRMKFADCLRILLIENVSRPKSNLSYIWRNLYKFPYLETLSLGKNNLRSCNFLQFETENKKTIGENANLLPTSLKALNLSDTCLNEKQIESLFELATTSAKSNLKRIYCENLSISQKTFDSIKTRNEERFQSLQIIGLDYKSEIPREDNILLDHKGESDESSFVSKIKKNGEQMDHLLRNTKSFPFPEDWKSFLIDEDFFMQFPIFLKSLREELSFLEKTSSKEINFCQNADLLLPKNNISLAQKTKNQDANKTEDEKEEVEIGYRKGLFIDAIEGNVFQTQLKNTDSMTEQRKLFLRLMQQAGFDSKTTQFKGFVEDEFLVISDLKEEHLSWDLFLSTFAIKWYDSLGVVKVEFNLSDDWFLEKSKRVNQYALHNMDFLVTFMSNWNIKPLDFVFGLEVAKEGEAEVKFSHSILKYCEVDLIKSLLFILDKGFILLQALKRMNLFSHEDASQAGAEAKQIRKTIKTQFKEYSKLLIDEKLL